MATAAQNPAVRRFMEGRGPFWLIGAFALLLIGTLWTALWFKASSELSAGYAHVRTETANLARAFEEHTVRTLASADQSLRYLKFAYQAHGTAVDLGAQVRDGLIDAALFNQIGVIDEHGSYVLSNLPNHQPIDLSDREHFRVHRDGTVSGLYVSKPVLGRASGKWSLQLTRRIDKADGSFGGVVVISIDPSYFTGFYLDVDLGRDGLIALTGMDGIVRARRTAETAELGQDVSRARLFDELKLSDRGSYVTNSVVDGIARIFSYRKLQGYPLVVVVGVGEQEALAPYLALHRGYYLFGGVMSAVVLAFAWLAAVLLHRQRAIAARLEEGKRAAESASRMKSEFLAAVSHELRTPLGSIIGYAEMLRDSLDGDANREFALAIQDSGQLLLHQVNDILDLSSVQAGMSALHPSEEPVRPMLERICARFRARAAEKGLALHLQLGDDLMRHFRCDWQRVAQILESLLDNAIKFTDSGSIELCAAPKDGGLCLAVRDTGRGIAADQQGLIFEFFRQAEAVRTRSAGGLGLGLAISRALAGRMGGSIEVSSKPGTGSTFSLHLPPQAA
jgi:signal transduction histidine kinase